MEIAVNGIDGSGKSTFIESALAHFRNLGIEAAVIDFPYFRQTKGFGRINPLLCACGEWLETKNRFLFGVYMVFFSAALYWIAVRITRKAQVVLVEHHPRIAMMPYASLYGKRMGSLFASLIQTLWRKPDFLVLLAIDPYESHRRILRRGRRLQWRQSPEGLAALQRMLREAAKDIPLRYVSEDSCPTEILDTLGIMARRKVCQ